MNVRQARQQLLDRFGLTSHHDFSLCDDRARRVLTVMRWLHGLSAAHMEASLGPNPAWHPDYPQDVDEATEMTDAQVTELYNRMESI